MDESGVQQTHPLTRLLMDAAAGRFPPSDGTAAVVPSPPGPSDGVVAFTGYNVVAADIDRHVVLGHLRDDDPAAPMRIPFLAWLADHLRTVPGMLDVVMVAPNIPPEEDLPELVPRENWIEHPRLARSRQYRRNLAVYSDPRGALLMVLGDGLAGRREMGLELPPDRRGSGLGRLYARAAARLVPHGVPLFAQISPGNVASIRMFLAAGYRPICSEVLFLRSDQS